MTLIIIMSIIMTMLTTTRMIIMMRWRWNSQVSHLLIPYAA